MSDLFRIGTPIIVDPEDDPTVPEGDVSARVWRMSPSDRDAYLQELISRLTEVRDDVRVDRTEASIIFTERLGNENVTVIGQQMSGSYSDEEIVYLCVMIVGGLVLVWFIFAAVNAMHRFTSNRLLTVPGLGDVLNRLLLAFSAILAIRRSHPSRLGSTDIEMSRLAERLRDEMEEDGLGLENPNHTVEYEIEDRVEGDCADTSHGLENLSLQTLVGDSQQEGEASSSMSDTISAIEEVVDTLPVDEIVVSMVDDSVEEFRRGSASGPVFQSTPQMPGRLSNTHPLLRSPFQPHRRLVDLPSWVWEDLYFGGQPIPRNMTLHADGRVSTPEGEIQIRGGPVPQPGGSPDFRDVGVGQPRVPQPGGGPLERWQPMVPQRGDGLDRSRGRGQERHNSSRPNVRELRRSTRRGGGRGARGGR